MVSIFLGNKNLDSAHSDIVINLSSGVCTGANNLKIERQELLSRNDFTHPLLAHKPLNETVHVYHYEYDDNKGLMESAINVYATLIHSQNPSECAFKITPSSAFLDKQRVKRFYFSTHENRAATETISIKQLESIVSSMSGITFRYAEKTIIDDVFTMVDLPAEVDSDLLYERDEDILNWLETPMDSNRLEIRYIKPGMGFGVYSRDSIKNGEVIAVYSGIKQVKRTASSTRAYSFEANVDALNMYVDAHQQGNITRFINHAPDSCPDTKAVFEANITSRNYRVNGIEFIIYFARKDIMKGVQLLVDYGASYFKNQPASLFKTKISGIGSTSLYLFKKNRDIRVMADHGVAQAQRCLFLRILIISGLVLAGVEGFLFLLKGV